MKACYGLLRSPVTCVTLCWMEWCFFVSSSTCHIKQDKRKHLRATVYLFCNKQSQIWSYLIIMKKNSTCCTERRCTVSALISMVSYVCWCNGRDINTPFVCHNKPGITFFLNDFICDTGIQQIENDKVLRFQVCSLPLWFLESVCSYMREIERDSEKERPYLYLNTHHYHK